MNIIKKSKLQLKLKDVKKFVNLDTKKLLKQKKAQLNIENVILVMIVLFVFYVLASSLWVSTDNELGDDISNAQFGSTGRTLLNITIMLILPALIIAGAAKKLTGRNDGNQYV